MKSRLFIEKPLTPVCALLTKKIQKDYIDLSWILRKAKGIGDNGIARAKRFNQKLETFDNDAAAFSYAFNALAWHDGKGDLGNSKNLRLLIARTLCEYANISTAALEREANRTAPVQPIMGFSYELNEVTAARTLISIKNRTDILELQDRSTQSPPGPA